MPPFPIVDAHVHLWDPTRFRMSWLDGNDLLNRPYTLEEYRQHGGSTAVAAMVYLEVEVEPAYALLEARWAAERAIEDPRIQAIVAWAPLEFGDQVRAFLEALLQVDPRIKGVRRVTQAEPDAGFCARPAFIRGAQILAEYGLSCDLCVYHPQLPAVIDLVRQCPDTWFILDHLGKPDIRGRLLDPWRSHLQELAALPNVFCKISGLVTEADHQHWTPEDLRPYVEHAIEVFGEDRLVFGGDWPVVLQAASYERWIETLDQLTAGLSMAARQKLWSENARRFYRIG